MKNVRSSLNSCSDLKERKNQDVTLELELLKKQNKTKKHLATSFFNVLLWPVIPNSHAERRPHVLESVMWSGFSKSD